MKRYKRILVQLGVLLLIAAVFMFPIMDDLGWRSEVKNTAPNDLDNSYPAPVYTSYPPPFEGYPPPYEGYPPPVILTPTEEIVPTLPLIETYTPTPLPTVPPPPTPAPY